MTVSKEENPRQKLFELIAERGPITIKDLRQTTGMSVGSIYHHLSKLEQYLAQDEQKRYLLSPKGREFFDSQSVIQMQNLPLYASFIMPALRNRYSSVITILAVLQLYILIYADSSQLLLLPVNHGALAESVGFGWVLSVLTAEGLSIAAGARAGHGLLRLAAGISLSTIPMAALSLIGTGYASIPLYIIAVFIATAAVCSTKNLSYPSSACVALSVLLLSIAVFTAGLGPILILPVAIVVALIALARLGYFEMVGNIRY